jgi:hypothetical protein
MLTYILFLGELERILQANLQLLKHTLKAASSSAGLRSGKRCDSRADAVLGVVLQRKEKNSN